MYGISKSTAFSFVLVTLLLGIANASEGQEALTYRLHQAKSMHLDDANVAQQYGTTLRDLGCKVETSGHQGHFDLTYSCPEWQKANFESHGTAHKWQRWLAALGFEVQHRHD